MSIEYIELKKEQPNFLWNDDHPKMYLDEEFRVELSDDSLCNYNKTSEQINKHSKHYLRSFNKQNHVLNFMPFASRKLREKLDDTNTKRSQIPLITQYGKDYIIYISHDNKSALLKMPADDVGNECLAVLDSLYDIN